MPCLLVSAAAGSSEGSTTKTCPLIAYVTGICQSQPVPWVLVTLKQKLHLVFSQIVASPALCQEHAGPLLCHIHSYWRQDEEQCLWTVLGPFWFSVHLSGNVLLTEQG